MKICLDAGHYGNYNQGVVKSYYEAKVVWDITNLQKKYLEEYEGVSVVLTRETQTKDLALYDRGAKAKGFDLFISNHSNACDTESVDYPVVIRAVDNKNNAEALAKPLAEVIAKTMGTRDKGRTWTRANSSGGEYYGVLRGARAVGCKHYFIIEHSFHTNKKACNWLLNNNNLEKLVKAEVEVIAKHYGLKKKGNTSAPVAPNGSYTVKINTDVLNVRAGAGTQYKITTKVKKGEVYTIVETKDNWGKLKSGAGWICLDYTIKR